MKQYITYFDFLGFKKFILNNDSDYITNRIEDILQNIESSIGQGKIEFTNRGAIADISNSRLNCLNISDTVIFWTNDDSLESFEELLKVSFDFNWRVTCYHFPVRGAIVYGEINIVSGYQETKNGGTYNVNSIYGKGLVNAHIKAENLNLASCVIDKSVIEKVREFGEPKNIFSDYAMKYQVPYKNEQLMYQEYLLKFVISKKLNPEVCRNRAKGIEYAFSNDNKGMDQRSEILLSNTIDFLELLKDDDNK